MDLAVPRDVSPLVRELDGIELLYLDAIQEIIDGAIERKRQEIPLAEAIIEQELDKAGLKIFHTSLLELSSRV